MKPYEQLRQLPFSNFGGDLENIYESMPYSSFKKWIPSGNFHEKSILNFPLQRLGGVRSLGFLSHTRKDHDLLSPIDYSQTRYDHSITVAIVLEDILKRNGFDQKEIELGFIAGLTHDIGTPACGDATKKVDREALDEEKNYWKALGKNGQNYLRSLGITRKIIESIIENKGILGQALDVADRVVYTMKDLRKTVDDDMFIGGFSLSELDPNLLPIRYILSHYLNVGDIYKEVGINRKNNTVFFNDPEHLKIFLFLRAYMHKILYLDPANQARDLFIKQLISPLYSRNGDKPLNPKKLRDMTDEQLLTLMQNIYQPSEDLRNKIFWDLKEWVPKFEKFETYEDAEEFEKKLKAESDIVIIDKPYECKGFNTGTSYNVLADEQGHIKSFKEYFPSAARELELIAESTKGVFVFYTNINDGSPINNVLKQIYKRNSDQGLKI